MSTATHDAGAGSTAPTRFVPVFLALFALGLLGLLSLIPTAVEALSALPPELADLPQPLLVALSLANTGILLVIAVALGTLLAHRVGLRSLLADKLRLGTPIWSELQPHIGLAVVGAVAFLAITLAIDFIVLPLTELDLVAEGATLPDLLNRLMLGILYGGITEELLLRWGVMSLFVWIGWWVVQRGQGAPRAWLVWTAIVLAAVLFGLGHLPALASVAPLTPLLVARTVFLNALGGLLFGWLYWRRSLEVAMVSHAAFHVALFFFNLAWLALH